MDSYLDSSVLDSSFLAFPGLRAEASVPPGPPWAGWSHGPRPAQNLRHSLHFSTGLCWTNEK